MSEGWKQPYFQSMALCDYINSGGHDSRRVTEYWHRAFCCIAKYIGFGRATRRILWDELVQGNWERLHLTDDECAKAPSDWLDELCGDVWYCSDRWSLDRLTRCHWTYRAYEHSIWRRRELGVEVDE